MRKRRYGRWAIVAPAAISAHAPAPVAAPLPCTLRDRCGALDVAAQYAHEVRAFVVDVSPVLRGLLIVLERRQGLLLAESRQLLDQTHVLEHRLVLSGLEQLFQLLAHRLL